jgi:integrase
MVNFMAGTFEKRGKKWHLQYMYKGKRYSKTIEIEKYKDEDDEKNKAKRLLDRFTIEVEDNYKQEEQIKLEFDNFSDEWMEKYVEKNLSPLTIEFYKRLVNGRLKKYFGYKDISNIRRIDVINFLDNFSGELSQQTLKKYRNCLVTMFNYAIEREYLQFNPAENVKLPKGRENKVETNIYNYQQLMELFNSLEKEEESRKIFIYIVMFTGMRREECCPLLDTDIDYKHNQININKAMVYTKEKGIIIGKPKNKSSIRKVDIPNILSDILKDYTKRYINEHRLFPFTPTGITNWFKDFRDRENRIYKKDQIKNGITDINKHIKFPRITLHGLRHSYATYLLNQTNDLNAISTLLGHSNTYITSKIYIEKSYENTKKVVKAFDK